VTRKTLLLAVALLVGACASAPKTTTIQPLAPSSGAPFDNVLVVSLFDSFDVRRYLETELVKSLKARGVNAVASTSKMDSRTPVARETFAAMVDELGSDAVLVTRLVSLKTEAKMKDMRPEETVNVWPTYYYNVWAVDVTEYVEPQAMQLDQSVVLSAHVFSVAAKEPVWGIETDAKIVSAFDEGADYSIFVDEANLIVKQLVQAGVINK